MGKSPEKSKYPKPMSFVTVVFWTGLFGGLFWGTVGFFAYYFNFTEIRPNIILGPWALGEWKNEWLGTVISIILLGILSVGGAFVYSIALKKFNGIWLGLGYGIALFLIVYLVLNPVFSEMKPFLELSRNTVITSICLYLVYGLFIGYSINYEYENNHMEENETAS
ncbi:YqhR family membrane protein [Neobacillus niacini]|uniref:YqhR family membrane protein n=1 Tax=Neobacillus niacini TaxID=86668 RepID=UPI00203A56A9|nr:YqhR family membrane protein [Neobacillus niacini]MCM3692465.1 YqhR family membrane protein [Neobacillus niacini]